MKKSLAPFKALIFFGGLIPLFYLIFRTKWGLPDWGIIVVAIVGLLTVGIGAFFTTRYKNSDNAEKKSTPFSVFMVLGGLGMAILLGYNLPEMPHWFTLALTIISAAMSFTGFVIAARSRR